MNLIEFLFGPKILPNPMKRQNMEGNIDYCKECRTEWEAAQPYNTRKVLTDNRINLSDSFGIGKPKK